MNVCKCVWMHINACVWWTFSQHPTSPNARCFSLRRTGADSDGHFLKTYQSNPFSCAGPFVRFGVIEFGSPYNKFESQKFSGVVTTDNINGKDKASN